MWLGIIYILFHVSIKDILLYHIVKIFPIQSLGRGESVNAIFAQR